MEREVQIKKIIARLDIPRVTIFSKLILLLNGLLK